MIPSAIWKDSETGEVLEILKVYFIGEQDKWLYGRTVLKPWQIIDMVNENWKEGMEDIEHGKYVPKFKQTDRQLDAHIRVKFDSKLKATIIIIIMLLAKAVQVNLLV